MTDLLAEIRQHAADVEHLEALVLVQAQTICFMQAEITKLAEIHSSLLAALAARGEALKETQAALLARLESERDPADYWKGN